MRGRIANYIRRWAVLRDCPSAAESAAISIASIAAVCLVWWLLTLGPVEKRIIDPITLPSLSETVKSFPRLWFDRALARSAVWSLGRVFGGFVLAGAVAVPLGILAGVFLRLHAFLKPLSIFGRNIPVAALIPLTLMWFGLGEVQKVMFIFFASVAFVFFDSATAVQGVPNSYLDAAYTLGVKFSPKHGLKWAAVMGVVYGAAFAAMFLMLVERPILSDAALRASWSVNLVLMTALGFFLGGALWFPIVAFQAIRKVLFPLAMPDVVNSLRLLFGLAFGYIMLAEVINAEFGLGAIINISQRQGPREHIYLSLLLIALLAFCIDRVILAFQRRMFPYRQVGA